jgi:hypothetical protein
MNTRHAYGLIGNYIPESFRKEYGYNTAAYLMKRFPGKVANIMLNTASIQYGYAFTPIQMGKWDAAFALLNNPESAFDFAGSPFGDDAFDAGFLFCPSVAYRDIFTGFIFYKPLEEHFGKTGFAHEFDGFEDTVVRRSSYIDKSQVEHIRKRIEQYKKDRSSLIISEPIGYAVIVNLLNLIVMPSLILLSLILSFLVQFFSFRNDKVEGSSLGKDSEGVAA